jgi:hypothetical protein
MPDLSDIDLAAIEDPDEDAQDAFSDTYGEAINYVYERDEDLPDEFPQEAPCCADEPLEADDA